MSEGRLPRMEVDILGVHYCSMWNEGSSDFVHLRYDPETKTVFLDELVIDMRQVRTLHKRLAQVIREEDKRSGRMQEPSQPV